MSRHALIKITGSNGDDLGQGVVCLRDAVEHKSRWSPPRLLSTSSTTSSTSSGKSVLCIELSSGGKKMGRLYLRVRLSHKDPLLPIPS